MCACVYVFLCFFCVMEYSFTFYELTIPPNLSICVYVSVYICVSVCSCVLVCERERVKGNLEFDVWYFLGPLFFFKTGLPWTDRLIYMVSEPLSTSPELEL